MKNHRTTLVLIASLVTIQLSFAQGFDPAKAPVVYQQPGMEKVIVEQGLPYKTINDTTLTFDIYYPPGYNVKSILPLVIFNNGVGGNELPTWKVYKDWARLAAVNGMIAVNHQSRRGKTLKDSEDLVSYIRTNASKLKVDADRIAIWACSGNVGAGMPLAMQADRKYIKALVMYYGAGWREEDNIVKRQDLEILVVRAGLDFYNLNRSIASFMQSALQTDAHVEFINYPEGQHAFDVVDDTPRSREIVKQTLDFLSRNLSKEHVYPESFVLTNAVLWNMIMDQKKTDEALSELKKAIAKYRAMPGHTPMFNHIIDERNLNQMGYELLQADRTADAIKVFTANQEAFPDSPNVYDALGDAYEKSADREKAIMNSNRAIEKLDKANLPEPYKQAIRESAEAKLKRLK